MCLFVNLLVNCQISKPLQAFVFSFEIIRGSNFVIWLQPQEFLSCLSNHLIWGHYELTWLYETEKVKDSYSCSSRKRP